MAIIQISKIQVRTGNVADLPQLSAGEFGWADDERRLFIGNDANRVGDPDPNNTEILTKYSPIELNGNVTIANVANFSLGGGNNGYFLQTNGNGLLSWSAVPNAVAGTVAGSTNQIQYNNAGSLNASANLTYYDANTTLVVAGNINSSNLSVANTAIINIANITTAYFSGNANISNGLIFATRITVDQANVNANIVANTITANLLLRAAATLEVNDGSGSNTAGNLIVGNSNVRANAEGITLTGNLTAQGFVSGANASFSSNANIGNATVNVFISNGNIVATNNITSNNITVSNSATVNTLSVTNVVSNLVPNANVTYNLGNNTNRWNDIYLSNSTIYLGDSTLSANAGDMTISNANLIVNGNVTGNSLSLSGNIATTGNVVIGNATVNVTVSSGNLTATGNIVGANANISNIVSNTITANSANFAGNVGIVGNVSANNANFSGNITAFSITGNVNTSTVVNGNSNIYVAPNANISFAVNGQPDVIVINSDGSTANTTIANSVTVGNVLSAVTLVGNLVNGNSNIRIVSNSNVQITAGGNSIANFTTTSANINGNINATGNVIGLNFVGTFANGSSNISIPSANGNILFSAFGGSNVLVVANSGVFVTGEANVSGNATLGGNITANIVTANLLNGSLTTAAQPNITSIGNLTSLTVTGTANVAGNVSANILIAGNGIVGQLLTNAQQNITQVGQLSNLVIGSTGTATFYANGSFLTTGNGYVSSNFGVGSYLTATFGSNSNAQPNITSVGNLTSLTVVGNTSVSNIEITGDITSPNSNLTYDSANALLTVTRIDVGNTTVGNIQANILAANVVSFKNTTTIVPLVYYYQTSVTPNPLVTLDTQVGVSYLYTSPSTGDFIIDIVNLANTTFIQRNTTVSAVFKNANAVGYVANSIRIDGAAANIAWINGAPSPVTGGYDVYTFDIFRSLSDTYFVIGKRESTS